MRKPILASLALLAALSACKDKTPQLPVEKAPVAIEEAATDTIPVVQEPVVESAPKPADKYFLIAGSFLLRERAERYSNELSGRGYVPQIVQRNWGVNSGYFRVAIGSYHDRSTAYAELNRALNDPNELPVWLLVK